MFAAVLTSENGLVTCMNLHRLLATKRYHLPELISYQQKKAGSRQRPFVLPLLA
jgi:hypothetical protein